MKTVTTLSIVAITALLIGCGGGGGGGGATPNQGTSSSIAAGGTSSSTAGGSASSQASQGFEKFDARNLSGYTVFIEDKDDLLLDIKEYIYIFETDSQVKLIINRNDGGQVVYENGTYEIKDDLTNAKIVDIYFKLDEGSSVGDVILLEDDLSIKENQVGTYVTKILPNESNGVVIKDNTPADGGLTVNSVDDLKGYTITSNVAHPGTSGATMELSVAFKCDGSFDYMTDYSFGGTHAKNNYTGSDVNVDEYFDVTRLQWNYTDENGEQSAGQIDTDVNNQLLEGTCWYDTNNDGSCSNDLKIKTISGSGC